jgi:hypothetical protein
MSVTAAFTALGAAILTINPTPQTALRRVFVDPPEQLAEGDMPCAIIRLAPEQVHSFSRKALGNPGLLRHDYYAEVVIALAGMELGWAEAHARAKYYPEAVGIALAASATLSGAVQFIGTDGNPYFSYSICEPMQWSDQSKFWAMRFTLALTELVPATFA